ncbi:hypothetical protein LQ564_17305 [Massilia sp. G4R7]|uniref:DUF2631 domain-containing protein n=1 Tax=Massilia phyllostachyos TaxID=2898585 RepID=A0ABS8QAT8_9BURK|nr:hypothetical protein [Massilia phyllostachyos]MCD2518071.1 hypothetical protein [Massilia phyllostachyos]
MAKKYWFSAKPPGNGWGWGPPFTWQGWLVFAAFFVLLIGGGFHITPYGVHYYVAYTCALAGLLMLICSRKGEPPGRFPTGER